MLPETVLPDSRQKSQADFSDNNYYVIDYTVFMFLWLNRGVLFSITIQFYI